MVKTSLKSKLIFMILAPICFGVGFALPPIGPVRAQPPARNIVIMNGDVYELVPYHGAVPAPMPVPSPAPQPAPPNPLPNPLPAPGPDNGPTTPVPPPADDLAKLARDYIYVIPAFERQVGKEAKAGTLKTRKQAYDRGNQLKDVVGVPFGKAVDAAVLQSGGVDASGNFVDPAKFDAIMQRIAEAQEAIIRNP